MNNSQHPLPYLAAIETRELGNTLIQQGRIFNLKKF
jgi:hypothetical protein